MADNHFTINRGLTLNPQTSAPSNPNDGDMYYDSTLNKFQKYENGVWKDLGGLETSDLNFIGNPDFETDLSGWETYADAAGVDPVDGTGGTATSVLVRDTGALSIMGDASMRWDKPASNEQGEGFSYDFTVGNGVRNNARLNVSFYYALSGTYVTGDMAVFVYDVTNSTLIGRLKTGNDGDILSGASVNSANRVAGYFIPTGAADYRLIFHTVTTSTSAYDLTVDQVKVSPDSFIPGFIAEDIGTETWADSEANSTTSVKLTRKGNRIFVDGTSTVTGVFSGSSFRITIPSAYTIDSAHRDQAILGDAHLEDTGTGFNRGAVARQTSTELVLYAQLASATYVGAVQLSVSAPHSWVSGDYINFQASWIVDGWKEAASFSTAEVGLTTVKAVYKISSGTANSSFADGAVEIVDFDTFVEDTHSRVSTGASWAFTAPSAGTYQVSAFSSVTSSTNLGSGALYVYKNGSQYALLTRKRGEAAVDLSSSPVDVVAAQGDTIDIRALWDTSDSSARTLATTADSFFVSIVERPDFTHFSVHGKSYEDEVILTADTATVTADTYVDVTGATLTIPAGKYELGFDGTAGLQWASGSGSVGMNISITDNANNVISGGVGILIATSMSAASDGTAVPMSRKVIINIAESTTYKLRVRCSESSGVAIARAYGVANIFAALTDPDNHFRFYVKSI